MFFTRGVIRNQSSIYNEAIFEKSKKGPKYASVFILLRKQLPEVFYRTGGLKNFLKLTGKPRCKSLFFHKVAD